MDEDEKTDRQSGGRKMSDHSILSFLCCEIPICKRSATAQVVMKRLPSQSSIAMKWAPLQIHLFTAPFSSSHRSHLVSVAMFPRYQVSKQPISLIVSYFTSSLLLW